MTTRDDPDAMTTPGEDPGGAGADAAPPGGAAPDAAPSGGGRIGLVDGSTETGSRSFQAVLDPEAMVQLDELVAVTTTLPDGRSVTHYGIVTELRSRFEGADLPSDTARVVARALPAEHVRRAEIRVLRVFPELFVSPHAGAPVLRAVGEHRAIALFEDEMTRGKLPVGLDLGGEPVHADMRFVDGRAGGHVSISGISGVATKTSYALFLLYQLLETDRGMDLLGGRAEREGVRALVFNTKGEDLLHVDRPNRVFGDRPEAIGGWRTLGIEDPGPFRSVRLYAPRASESSVPQVRSRQTADVNAYGWTPEEFIREQLLQFCFTSEDERGTQVGLVEQRVRVELLRRLRRPAGERSGAAVILELPPSGTGYNPDRLAAREPEEAFSGEGTLVRDFGELVTMLERIEADDAVMETWFGRAAAGTRQAFLRRLAKLRRRLDPVIGCGLAPVSAENARIHVVDISTLHDDAQRFVVGALLDRIWREKQGSGRTPLRFVVLDELNKYAPATGFSPIKELLVDIAERGRSLGVLLIGAQQAASAVAAAVPRNASLKVAGRLDASEADAYRFLTPALRERATRFLPGTMVVSQPIVPEPIPIRFPFPPFATNPEEAARDEAAETESADRIQRNIAAARGPEVGL